MSISTRIKEAREHKGLTRTDLARLLGVTQSAVSNYENGISSPKEEVLFKLFSALDVDPNYIFQDEIAKASKKEVISLAEHSHLRKYRTLDEHGKKIVDMVLDEEHEHIQHIETNNKAEPKTRFIERYYLPVSAGTGVYIDGNIQQKEMIEAPINEKTAKANFVLTVSGDSMEPKFSEGDDILIQSMPCIEVGELGIFILNNEVYFKRKGKQGLESLNPNYPAIEIKEWDSIVCKGKVIGKL